MQTKPADTPEELGSKKESSDTKNGCRTDAALLFRMAASWVTKRPKSQWWGGNFWKDGAKIVEVQEPWSGGRVSGLATKNYKILAASPESKTIAWISAYKISAQHRPLTVCDSQVVSQRSLYSMGDFKNDCVESLFNIILRFIHPLICY